MKTNSWLCLGFLPLLCFAEENPQVVTPKEDVAERSIHGDLQGKIASHGVKSGLFISASYLYFKPMMDNLEYVTHTCVNVANSLETGAVQASSEYRNPDFQWSSGERGEIGYIFENREQWKLSLTGTRLNSHARDAISTSSAISNQLTPIWYPTLMGQLLSQASAEWHLKFRTLDLALGRDFFISRWISVFPFMGLREVSIKQRYIVKYTGFYNAILPDREFDFVNDNRISFRNHFRGFGFRFGTDLLFHLTKNIGIIGEVAGSLVYGKFSIREHANGAFPTDDVSDVEIVLGHVNACIREKIHRVRANFDSELGLQFEAFFNKDKNRFILSASYAYSIWFNQLEFRNNFASPNIDPPGSPFFPGASQDPSYQVTLRQDGNLQFRGLIAKAGLDF